MKPLDPLLAEVKAGTPQALEQFQATYTPLVRYIISPILSDVRDREECLSDVFLLVWQHISSYDPNKGSLTAWLTTIARNAALNHSRAQRRHGGHIPLEPWMQDPQETPEESLMRREQHAALRVALERLSVAERDLFLRKYYYRQTTAQIARETGQSLRAVEGKLYRIRKHLQRELGGDDYE